MPPTFPLFSTWTQRFGGPLRRGINAFCRSTCDLVFPPQCLQCEVDLPSLSDAVPLCDECRLMLAPEKWLGCHRCGAPTRPLSPAAEGCPRCGTPRPHFDRVFPLGIYADALRDAILKTKRLSHEAWAAALGGLLATRRGEEMAQAKPDVIVPIPMHWRRRFLRGTNSPEIVAACLERRLALPVRHLLLRTRNTRPQKDLHPHERRSNVRGAFRVRRQDRLRWKDSHVLLVDDILTTGATCSEAARVLKQMGVRMVSTAVLAKAQGP